MYILSFKNISIRYLSTKQNKRYAFNQKIRNSYLYSIFVANFVLLEFLSK